MKEKEGNRRTKDTRKQEQDNGIKSRDKQATIRKEEQVKISQWKRKVITTVDGREIGKKMGKGKEKEDRAVRSIIETI